VWAEPAQDTFAQAALPRTRAWIEALPPDSKRAFCHFMYQTDEDEYQSLAEFNDLPVEDYPKVHTVDISNFMNHSADPSCWFVDGGDDYEGVMVATRDLRAGDEITFDYATSEACELSPEWDCLCGTAECRARVTPHDWQIQRLQEKYRGHFLPHIAAKIAKAQGADQPTPLEPVDVRSSWWVRQRFANAEMPAAAGEGGGALPSEQSELLARRASGLDLDTVNRQAAMLIVLNGLEVRAGGPTGSCVHAGERVAAGEVVMLLPPHRLLWDSQVDDPKGCVQVGVTRGGASLFSSSITTWDLGNHVCHSGKPNCKVVVGSDLVAGLIATRAIEAGEAVTFDHALHAKSFGSAG